MIDSHQWEESYEYVVNGRDIFDWKCGQCGMKARMTLATEPGQVRPRPPFDAGAVQLMAGGLAHSDPSRRYFGHEELARATCSEIVAELDRRG